MFIGQNELNILYLLKIKIKTRISDNAFIAARTLVAMPIK